MDHENIINPLMYVLLDTTQLCGIIAVLIKSVFVIYSTPVIIYLANSDLMSVNVCCFVHADCYADLTQQNRNIDNDIKLYIHSYSI